MDLVLKLRELRARRGLKQEQVARRAGIGVKPIPSHFPDFAAHRHRIAAVAVEQVVAYLKRSRIAFLPMDPIPHVPLERTALDQWRG